jgi:hypothetical protein
LHLLEEFEKKYLSPNLSVFLGEYSHCGSNKIGTSSTFSFFMCKLEKKIQIIRKVPKFQKHNTKKIKNFKQAIA